MDLKSLIAKMDQIESKKFLTESEKKETSWTDMKGNKHSATKVKGKSYGNQPEPKEVDNEGKAKKKVKEDMSSGAVDPAPMIDYSKQDWNTRMSRWMAGNNPWMGTDEKRAAAWAKLSPADKKWIGKGDPLDQVLLSKAPNKGRPSAPVQSQPPMPVNESTGIYNALMEEFGLSERVTINPDGTVSGGLRPQKPAVPNPYTGADAQKFASLSPEDQEWLTRGGGKPDINDPYIMRRAPNKGQPVANVSVTSTQTKTAAQADADYVAGQSAQPDFSKQDAEIDAISKEFEKLPSASGGAQTSPVAPQPNITGTPLPPASSSNSNPTANNQQSAPVASNQSSAETNRLARAGTQRPTQSAQPAARPVANVTGAGRPGPTRAAAAGGDPTNPLNKLSTAYSPSELQTLINLMSKMPK